MTSAWTLDTAGAVECSDPAKPCICHARTWEQLSPFVQGYVRALYETANLRLAFRTSYGEHHRPAQFSDLAPEALALILEDCANFENFTSGLGFKTGEVEGRRFWNGRAKGQLTGAWGAAFPPLRVYLDDAGKVQIAAVSE